MFTSQGPTLRELAVQALSSIERGYDLLAPKFDQTPFRTPDRMLDAVEETLARHEGPFDAGLDVCCGTGAGLGMLLRLCRGRVTGVDLSSGMLAEAALAYLGLGTPTGQASWGRMLYEAQTTLRSAPHLALIPGGAIALSVLGFNLFGDGLRDRLDPKLESR